MRVRRRFAARYRAGVPDSIEAPSNHGVDRPHPAPTARPIDAVLFDFHGTLAQVEEPVARVTAAAASCGVTLDRGRATGLADRLVTAGLAGGPLPYRIPPQLAEVWAERDLYPHAHREAYTGLAATVASGIDGLPEALYERLLSTEGWVPYPDAGEVLRRLRAAGIRTGVVSNIGFDIRPMMADFGLADLVDAYALSYEVGRCKPEAGIFYAACAALRVDPERTLMVGDTPADAGAVGAGCSALVLPASPPGRRHGLGAVLGLVSTE